MSTKILWIEGATKTGSSFVPALRRKGYVVETAPNGKTALSRLDRINPGLVVVNAASLRTSGLRICRALRSRLNGRPILLIQGEGGRPPGTAAANQTLELPFTQRKLLNRVRALVPDSNGQMLRAGRITLYPDCNSVWLAGSEPQRLTPRLTALLEMLMQHPGEVVPRERLFRKVWQTDYVEDTRTLDVHISWLRQKIESDPRSPRLLKTVRGVGYMLSPGQSSSRR